jgi:hypothetical protein
MTMALMLFILAGAPQDTDAYKRPPELVRAAAQREWRNARIEWSVDVLDEEKPRSIESISQFTRNEYIVTRDRGLSPTNVGPRPLTTRVLFYEQEYWNNYNDNRITVQIRSRDAFTGSDVRAAGMSASNQRSVAEATSRPVYPEHPSTYEVVQDGPYQLVTATVQWPGDTGPTRQHKWWIDPSRGWSVVRCQKLSDGRVALESISELKRYGDVWFPETVRYFIWSFQDGKEPYRTMRITSAKFDDPSLPDRLTPNDIGVEVGTNVNYTDRDGDARTDGWDGQKRVNWSKMALRVEAGELKFGENYLRQMREASAKTVARSAVREKLGLKREGELGIPAVSMTLSAWEVYVLRYIKHFELDQPQRERAWTIYRECKAAGDKHMESRKERFEKIKRQQRAAGEISDKADRHARLRALSKTRADLLIPIAKIFKDQLKRRLDRLPTRKQKAAAASKKWDPDEMPLSP